MFDSARLGTMFTAYRVGECDLNVTRESAILLPTRFTAGRHDAIKQICRIVQHSRRNVRVHVRGHPDRRMSECRRDCLEVSTAFQQQRCKRMAQVVQTNLRELCFASNVGERDAKGPGGHFKLYQAWPLQTVPARAL